NPSIRLLPALVDAKSASESRCEALRRTPFSYGIPSGEVTKPNPARAGDGKPRVFEIRDLETAVLKIAELPRAVAYSRQGRSAFCFGGKMKWSRRKRTLGARRIWCRRIAAQRRIVRVR